MHKKKDAKDWGVEPQIIIPMDTASEQKVLQDRYEQELFRRPVSKAETRPTTAATKVAATTQPIDPQLQQAVTTMIGLVVLQGGRDKVVSRKETPIAMTAPPTSAPADGAAPIMDDTLPKVPATPRKEPTTSGSGR